MARNIPKKDGVAEMRQQLKAGVPSSCILLYGEESFLVERFVSEIKERVLDKDTRDFNEIVLEGKIRPEMIISACETYPVFAERKLVIVKNSGLLKVIRKKKTEGKAVIQSINVQSDSDENEDSDASGRDSGNNDEDSNEIDENNPSYNRIQTDYDKKRVSSGKNEPETDAKADWKAFFENFPKHTLLVFVEESVNKTFSLYKQIVKYGMPVEMTFQQPDVLGRWVQKGFAKSEKQITVAVSDYLLHRSEDGMTILHLEIQKVCLYMGDRTLVTTEDIDAVVTPSIRSRVFDLMDAVAAGQIEKALQMLDDMLHKREPEQKIFYMISKQAGKLYQLKNMKQGLPNDVKASRLDMNPYALSKMERLAQRLSVSSLGHFVEHCMEMDLAVKKGHIKMRLALELLITSIGK